jgi:ABC-2 type transport system permease protein
MLNVLRQPEAMVMSIFVPAVLMLVFINVFGGSMNVGEYNFVNFIVPGILVNALVQSSCSTGTGVCDDMLSGIVHRFRSMAIAPSAFLSGHVLAAFCKTIITTSVAIGVAVLSGFRPSAGLAAWFGIIGLIALFILAITWFSVFLGVIMPDSSSVNGILTLIAMMVFLSPGMAPTENMPRGLRFFSENQPMGPFINTMRAMMNGNELTDNTLLLTLVWWSGILFVSFAATLYAYNKKLTV